MKISTEAQAKRIVEIFNAYLVGEKCIYVSVNQISKVDVIEGEFKDSWNSGSHVAISARDYSMTVAEEWRISPDKRTIIAETTNAYGVPLTFAWKFTGLTSQSFWELHDEVQDALRKE